MKMIRTYYQVHKHEIILAAVFAVVFGLLYEGIKHSLPHADGFFSTTVNWLGSFLGKEIRLALVFPLLFTMVYTALLVQRHILSRTMKPGLKELAVDTRSVDSTQKPSPTRALISLLAGRRFIVPIGMLAITILVWLFISPVPRSGLVVAAPPVLCSRCGSSVEAPDPVDPQVLRSQPPLQEQVPQQVQDLPAEDFDEVHAAIERRVLLKLSN